MGLDSEPTIEYIGGENTTEGTRSSLVSHSEKPVDKNTTKFRLDQLKLTYASLISAGKDASRVESEIKELEEKLKLPSN